jgi:DNA-binding beta-propeller fold protein YncE
VPYFPLESCLLLILLAFTGAELHPPGDRSYARIGGSGTILPGGRILQPYGTQIQTGPGTCAIAQSPKGTVATANTGPERFSVTIIDPVKTSWSVSHFWARTPNFFLPEKADPNWKGVSCGVAFDGDRALWIPEGHSGKLRLLDTKSGDRERIVDLNEGEWSNSISGDLVSDSNRHLLYAIDEKNRRLAVVDSKKGRFLASANLGSAPLSHIALSPDGSTAFLSGPNGQVASIDVHLPLQPSALQRIKSGPTDASVRGGGILVLQDRVFVSDPVTDSVEVISGNARKNIVAIPLRIPGLEDLRGIRPAGMAYDSVTKWLLVAETGLNAVGVVDTDANQLIGHIPVGWEPQQLAVAGNRVFVTNLQGRGTGPNLRHPLMEFGETPALHRGSISTFIIPSASDLQKLTRLVYAANGMIPSSSAAPAAPRPDAIQHVVLILKGNRSFDELLGDVKETNSSAGDRIQATPQLARFGMHGYAEGGKQRFSMKEVAVTPNQHSLAEQWAFSDNFYTSSTYSDGRILENHLALLNVSRRVFDEPDLRISDQIRAVRFIAEMRKLREPDVPSFLLVRLPNDELGQNDSNEHPYKASWVADNDLATGRIIEYLSHTSWWRNTTVFITEQASDSGLDHIDSHRVPLLAAGPWIRRNHVTHANSDSAGLVKTILSLLHLPPIGLEDATARDLRDVFSNEPDYSPFRVSAPDKRIFDPPMPQ